MQHRQRQRKLAQLGSGMIIALSGVAVFAIILIVVTRLGENTLEQYRTNRERDAWYDLYYRLRAAAQSPINLRRSAGNNPGFNAANQIFRDCFDNPAANLTDCPAEATNTDLDESVQSFNLINGLGARLAGHHDDPQFYTLDGRRCREDVDAPSQYIEDGVGFDCVVAARAYFVALCGEGQGEDPKARFNRDDDCPNNRVSEVLTSVRIEQVAAPVKAKDGRTSGLDNLAAGRRRRSIPNNARNQLRLRLNGQSIDQSNFFNFASSAGALSQEVDFLGDDADTRRASDKVPSWSFTDIGKIWTDDYGDGESNVQSCPPGAFFRGFDRSGQMICECRARVNTSSDLVGPAGELECATSCPGQSLDANDLSVVVVGINEDRTLACQNHGTYDCVDTPVDDDPEVNTSQCDGTTQRLGKLNSQECVMVGNQVDCSNVQIDCCGYFFQ